MVQQREMEKLPRNPGNHDQVEECGKKVSYGKRNTWLFLSIFLGLLGIGCLFIIQETALNDAKTKLCELSLRVSDLLKNETDQQNRLRELETSLNALIAVKIRMEKLGVSNNETTPLFNDITKKQQKMEEQIEENGSSLRVLESQMRNINGTMGEVQEQLNHCDGQSAQRFAWLVNITQGMVDSVKIKQETMQEQIEKNSSSLGILESQVRHLNDTVSSALGEVRGQLNHPGQTAELVERLDNTTKTLTIVMEEQETMKKLIEENSSSLMETLKSREKNVNDTISSALDEVRRITSWLSNPTTFSTTTSRYQRRRYRPSKWDPQY